MILYRELSIGIGEGIGTVDKFGCLSSNSYRGGQIDRNTDGKLGFFF